MPPVEPKGDCKPVIAFGNLIRRRSTDQESCLLRQRPLQIPLDVLEGETGLSRHTILRTRRERGYTRDRFGFYGSQLRDYG